MTGGKKLFAEEGYPAEHYCRKQRKIQAFMTANREDLKYLHYLGMMISYGWKNIKRFFPNDLEAGFR